MLDDRYMSPSEIADLFGVTPQTVRKWCRSLDCPHLDFSKNPQRPLYRLRARDVRDWGKERGYHQLNDKITAYMRQDDGTSERLIPETGDQGHH